MKLLQSRYALDTHLDFLMRKTHFTTKVRFKSYTIVIYKKDLRMHNDFFFHQLFNLMTERDKKDMLIKSLLRVLMPKYFFLVKLNFQ